MEFAQRLKTLPAVDARVDEHVGVEWVCDYAY